MEKYYVYDGYGGYNVYDVYSFENFVVKNGPWCFGNNLHDKRWSFKIRRHFVCCRKPIVEVEGEEILATVKYVVYNQYNELVTCKTIDQMYTQAAHSAGIYPSYRQRYRRGIRRYEHPNYPGFRNGPVPGTGGWGSGNYFRQVKTTQEKRFNCAHNEYTRGKRRNIPCSYDDIKITDHYTGHSWKKQHKKKQWM